MSVDQLSELLVRLAASLFNVSEMLDEYAESIREDGKVPPELLDQMSRMLTRASVAAQEAAYVARGGKLPSGHRF